MQKFQGQIVSILSQIISDKNKTLDIINICQVMLSEEKQTVAIFFIKDLLDINKDNA